MRFLCVAGVAAGLALLTAPQAMAGTPAAGAPDLRQAPVADTDLADMSGGTATLPTGLGNVLTNQYLTATNSGNVVSAGHDVNSGAVNLGANAFQGFGGIGNFVINTGNNNNLQGSLSVAINTATAAVGAQ